VIDDDPNYFTRDVVSRTLVDGCLQIVLSCGHTLIMVVDTGETNMPCAQCVNEYVDEMRAENCG
jgi:hypothetical protein